MWRDGRRCRGWFACSKPPHTRRPLLLGVYASLAGVAFLIVYRMQSRGAIFGSVVALAFGLFAAGRLRKYVLPAIILAGFVLVIVNPQLTFTEEVGTYLRRGQSEEQFQSMTGRTRAYRHSLTAFLDAPLIGRGNWTDRLVIGEHSHNSFIQALLNGGILGFVPYVGSWVAGWILFIRLLKRMRDLPEPDRAPLMEAGAVMLFFTVRAIPETTTASFAVDLLVMCAIYAYLEALTAALSQAPANRAAMSRLRTPPATIGLVASQAPGTFMSIREGEVSSPALLAESKARKRLRVLIVAYACNPERGSESGVGGVGPALSPNAIMSLSSPPSSIARLSRPIWRRTPEKRRSLRFVYVPHRWLRYKPEGAWLKIEGSLLKPVHESCLPGPGWETRWQ